jgi:hypothetical protein
MIHRTSSLRKTTGEIELEAVAAASISNGVQASASSRAKLLTFPWDARKEQHNVPSYVEELEGVAEWVKQTRERCVPCTSTAQPAQPPTAAATPQQQQQQQQ